MCPQQCVLVYQGLNKVQEAGGTKSILLAAFSNVVNTKKPKNADSNGDSRKRLKNWSFSKRIFVSVERITYDL